MLTLTAASLSTGFVRTSGPLATKNAHKAGEQVRPGGQRVAGASGATP